MSQSFYGMFFQKLDEEKVRYVLCGGLAIVLHNLRQFTHDADIALDFEEQNVLRFVTVMKKLGLSPFVPVAPEELCNAERRREWIETKNAIVFSFRDIKMLERQVDVFLQHPLPFEDLMKRCTVLQQGETQICVASPEDLLFMKRKIDPPRPHDLSDIMMLQKLIHERRDG